MKFRSRTLDNGLEIVAECNDRAYSTALGFFVRTGSRDESPSVAGVSHFLEHMVFKGTDDLTADDVNREFDAIGAHANAFTNEENTVFYAAVLPEYQDRALTLLASMLRPALRADDFDMERQVIVEEIRMYEDMPPFGADEHIRALHYGSHPLSRSVLGTVETIEAMTVDQMRAYLESRYSPSNVVLAATGAVDFDALTDEAERLTKSWTRYEVERDMSAPKTNTAFELLHKPGATQEYVLFVSDGPDAAADDRYPAKLLSTVVGDDTGSRIYWDLIDNGLAESAGLAHYEYDGAGLFYTFMSCDPERTSENLRILRDIYQRTQADGVTDREIEQAKNKVRSRIVLSSERPRGRLYSVGGDWLQRREYRSLRDDLEAVDAITEADIRAVLDKHPLTSGTMMAVGPLETLDLDVSDWNAGL